MSLIKLGLSTIGSATIIGSLPNISDEPAEANIKAKTVEGLGNIASTFPAQGKIIGAGMILKQTKKLRKSAKKLY